MRAIAVLYTLIYIASFLPLRKFALICKVSFELSNSLIGKEMAIPIIFRSLLLLNLILIISVVNFVYCDNTQNEDTSVAESNLIKMIKKYVEGSIDEYELIDFAKNNKDNFGLTENFEFSDKDLVKGLREMETRALACIEQIFWINSDQFLENKNINERDGEIRVVLTRLRVVKTCQNLIDEKKVRHKEECLTKIANGDIDITPKGNISYK